MQDPANQDTLPPDGRFYRLNARVTEIRNRYEKYAPASFFVGGFLFDIVTLSRVDDWFTIVQQFVYLIIVIQILKFKTLEQGLIWMAGPRLEKLWRFNNEALHFFLGSLLSSYTLFYFVSSSLATSFIFLTLIFVLLVVNELPMFQAQGLKFKFALFSLCLFSFLFILVPMTIGFVGFIPFIAALSLGLVIVYSLYKTLRGRNLMQMNASRVVFLPGLLVALSLVILYALKILPPIPLSIQYAGIYHQIEKTKDPLTGATQFVLKYERPFWKFWQNGAQSFVAQPGDKIHCFVRIFAPVNFSDQVMFHWLKEYPSGWQTMDRIPNTIAGGRTEGFRGYAIKSNFDPGVWRVQVETMDGREIGRIGFTVEAPTNTQAAASPREFRVDIY